MLLKKPYVHHGIASDKIYSLNGKSYELVELIQPANTGYCACAFCCFADDENGCSDISKDCSIFSAFNAYYREFKGGL